MAQLVFIDGRKMGTVVELTPKMSLGRAAGNDIVLDEKDVADRHAEVRRDGATYRIRRAGTAVRLVVNGQPVEDKPLAHGDIISIGDTTILFSDEHPSTRGTTDIFNKETPRGATPPDHVASRVQSFESTEAAVAAFRANERLASHVETLLRVGNMLNESLEDDIIAERLTQLVADNFHADRVFLILREDNGSLRVAKEFVGPGAREQGRAKLSRSILDQVMESKESFLTENAMEDERFALKQSIADQSIHSAMCVPILKKERVLGVIYADRTTAGRAYNEDDLQLLNGIAVQSALALENVRQHRRSRTYTAMLKRLGDASQKLSSIFDRDVVARTCVEDASDIFRCKRVTLMMVDGDVLRILYSNCIPKEQWKGVRVPLEQGLTGKALKLRRPLLQTDTKVIERKGLRRYQTDSYLIAPVPAHAAGGDARPGEALGVLNLSDRLDKQAFDNLDAELLGIYAAHVGIALTNASHFHRATTDYLTGLMSRQYFDDRLREVFQRPGTSPISLMMMDIDHFKTVNDTYGHPVGDEVIAALGRMIRDSAPQGALAGRYGGEEFVMAILDAAGAALAESVRSRIEETEIATAAGPLHVTCSIGAAVRSPGDTPATLTHRADQALYRAKNGGRNRVEGP